MSSPRPVADEVNRYGMRVVRALAKERPVTIADVMALARVTMRAANRFLTSEAATGRLIRSGGGPGEAFRWSLTPTTRGKARG